MVVLDQRNFALDKGNGVRMDRAVLKKQMKRREVDVHKLMVDPPELVETMRLKAFLLACPATSGVKAGKIMQTVRVGPTDRIGNLHLSQRCWISELLPV